MLASGVQDRLPEIEGFLEHYGESIFTCPSCGGFEAQGKRVGVIGWADEIADFAVSLLDWAHSVVIISDGHRFEGDPDRRETLMAHGVEMLEADGESFLGSRGDLQGMRLGDGSIAACEMAFFSLGHRPRTASRSASGVQSPRSVA